MNRPEVLIITGADRLARLANIPELVTEIQIKHTGRMVRLPNFSVRIERLSLIDVILDPKTRLHEGLKRLSITQGHEEDGLMIGWTFPSTLEEMIVYTRSPVVDLRAVTAPKITISESGHESRVLYPEALDRLILFAEDHTVREFPPYLRKLSLYLDTEGSLGDAVYPSVKEMLLSGEHEPLAFDRMFPNVEKLVVEAVFGKQLTIKSKSLRTMSIDSTSVQEPIILDTPGLESLTITSAYPEDKADLSLNTDLGKSLVSLTLESVLAFPVETEWNRLESITLIDSDVELPYIRWLEELKTDMPVMTNDQEVETIDEYKAAWGFTSKAKRA